MDISDLLHSVSGPTPSLHAEDLQALTRVWVNERSAPEVLPWPGALMERVGKGVGVLVSFLFGSFAPFPPNYQLKGVKTQEEKDGGVGRFRVG